jgi:hypothetical protein
MRNVQIKASTCFAQLVEGRFPHAVSCDGEHACIPVKLGDALQDFINASCLGAEAGSDD